MEPIGQLTVRNCTSRQQSDRRTIVLDDDLFSADELVTALSACGVTARMAFPVTADHVVDMVDWAPELALLNVDELDAADVTEIVTILRAAEISVVALTAQPGEPVARRLRDAGTVVVDKALLAGRPAAALADLLGYAELDSETAFSQVEWAAEVA
ncbi:MAG TPA: hypothetical protein VHX40_06745 [Acidimicrobiales bacterium]|jgi:hypothetical protein|nr:hypothetical protein [Acidimicrobiales bacterium]